MHTWCKIRMRWRIYEHTTGWSPGLVLAGLADQVHVGVLHVVVDEAGGGGRRRGLGRGHQVVLVIQRQRHVGRSGLVGVPARARVDVIVRSSIRGTLAVHIMEVVLQQLQRITTLTEEVGIISSGSYRGEAFIDNRLRSIT